MKVSRFSRRWNQARRDRHSHGLTRSARPPMRRHGHRARTRPPKRCPSVIFTAPHH